MADTVAFLSTCPGRGTTVVPRTDVPSSEYFYPRAPGGARPGDATYCRGGAVFLSTCPGRGTTTITVKSVAAVQFLSTCPGRGTTIYREHLMTAIKDFYPRAPGGARLIGFAEFVKGMPISIHVPREGHDRPENTESGEETYFYPRAPGGARRTTAHQRARRYCRFLSTCPGRGTTAKTHKICRRFCSIMAMI